MEAGFSLTRKRESQYRDHQTLADNGGKAVQHIEETGFERGSGTQMPQMLRVAPRQFARSAHVPPGESIFQGGGWREYVAQQAQMQCVARGIDESFQRCVDGCLIAMLRPPRHGTGTGSLTGGDDRRGEIVVNMSVDTRHGELNPAQSRLITLFKKNLPTRGDWLGG